MFKQTEERSIVIIGGENASKSQNISKTIALHIHANLCTQDKTSHLYLMSSPSLNEANIETISDLQSLTNNVTADPKTQIAFFIPHSARVGEGEAIQVMQSTIRSVRKDLYLVLASPTAGASQEEQYFTALGLMKSSHANLVFAYDTHTGNNMVVVPEEAFYGQSKDLTETIKWLMKIALARAGESFTRSHVIDAPLVPWDSPNVSQNFREVVDHLVARGAYKRFRGKTVGHFALRGKEEGEFLTSRRNHDFNKLSEIGLVRVFAKGQNEVTAHGSKPSVGGQSQRIIFNQKPDVSSIVHFHSPLRNQSKSPIPVREQWPFECGSHQCGQNTADGLKEIIPGVYAVMLENHGPNIVFGADVQAGKIIDLIECAFNLDTKTGYAPNERHQDTIILPRPVKTPQIG